MIILWKIKKKTHQRRKRYKGTHPKTFDAKYKEHQPTKYAKTIEKNNQKREYTSWYAPSDLCR